jgi:hypothetical protein
MGRSGCRWVDLGVSRDPLYRGCARAALSLLGALCSMADVAGNPKVRGQLTGGVLGIGMALLEETRIHAEFCRQVTADAPNIETIAVEAPHRMVGVAVAIAIALYHATGTRVRKLPVPIDKLLV